MIPYSINIDMLTDFLLNELCKTSDSKKKDGNIIIYLNNLTLTLSPDGTYTIRKELN